MEQTNFAGSIRRRWSLTARMTKPSSASTPSTWRARFREHGWSYWKTSVTSACCRTLRNSHARSWHFCSSPRRAPCAMDGLPAPLGMLAPIGADGGVELGCNLLHLVDRRIVMRAAIAQTLQMRFHRGQVLLDRLLRGYHVRLGRGRTVGQTAGFLGSRAIGRRGRGMQ